SGLSVSACSSYYDITWPARYSRSGPGLRSVSRCSCYFNFERSTETSALGELGGNYLPWLATRPMPISAKSWNVPGFSWTDIARKARGSSDRNRQTGRNATQDCRQG